MLSYQDVNYSLITAVREGRLERTRELISSFGLSYSQAWAEGYVLLCYAIENKHTAVAKLLLTSGSKVNSNSKKPCNTPLHFAVINADIEIVEMILDKGGSIDAKNKFGRTPLHNAIRNKKIEVTELLLKHRADANARDNDGINPLHVAVQIGCLQTVDHLIKYGAYVDCVCTSTSRKGYTPLHFAEKGLLKIIEEQLKYGAAVNMLHNSAFVGGFTPLHIAAKKKQEEVAKLLISYEADINAQDKTGKTPIFYAIWNADLKITNLLLTNRANIKDPDLLYIAVRKECIEIVEALLQHDADINASDHYGRTALHFTALSANEDIFGFLAYENPDINIKGEIAKLLLSKGAKVDAQTKNGETTLHVAIQNGYANVVEALLKYNANVNFGIKSDITPLHLSVEKGNEEISTMLLKKGANVNAKLRHGITALHIATENGHKEVVKVLLEYGAKVDSKIENGITPLHLGARKGYQEIIETNLKFGANIDSRDEYVNAKLRHGITALHIATQNGHKEVVKVLLEYGAKVDSKIENGISPLHLGAQKGYQEITETILKFGANIDSRDEYGRTALHIASEEGHVEVVVTLLEYGSDINITRRNNDTPFDHAMDGKRSFYKLHGHNSHRALHSYEGIAEALKRHIVKMKTANLYVSKKNLLLMSSSGEISYFQYECEKEIASMKSEKIINPNITFYDVLAKGTISLAIYMRNKNLVQVFKSDDYKTKFPIYASMIKSHFRKGMERKELLDKGSKIFHFLFNNFPELPYVCTEMIFSYLSDEDLGILMDACKPVNISNPNNNINDVVSSDYLKYIPSTVRLS